jgi:hypothetical protein
MTDKRSWPRPLNEAADNPPEDPVAVLRREYVPFVLPEETGEADWAAADWPSFAAELEARLAVYAAR